RYADLSAADLPLAAMFAGWAMADEVQRRIAADGMDDLRFADGLVFQHLVGGPIAIGELGERMGVTQQAASKSVADLERRGYVERVAGAADGRVRHVSLTERGPAATTAPRWRPSWRSGWGRAGSRPRGGCWPTPAPSWARAPPCAGGASDLLGSRGHTNVPLQVRGRPTRVVRLRTKPWGGFLRRQLTCAAAGMAAALAFAAPAGAADWTAGAPTANDPFFGDVGMGNGGYDVQHYSLDLDYDPATQVLDGRAHITLVPTQDLDQFNLDLRDWFGVSRVAVGKHPAAYFQEDIQELVITPRPKLHAGRSYTVH